MALKFMWGFEIGADVDYYANSGWGVAQNQSTGSDYALYDTQYYESHQPITNVGGGYRSLKQTSYYQHNPDHLGDVTDLLAFSGTYCEFSTPVTGGPGGGYQWLDGMVHFSFKHDFDFDQVLNGPENAKLGKWIHLCSFGSASSGQGYTPFFNGYLLRGPGVGNVQLSDQWMSMPASAPAGAAFGDMGWRPSPVHISFYLVRQENAVLGPCVGSGDHIVAITYEDDAHDSVPVGIFSSSIGAVPQIVKLGQAWSKFTIRYKAGSGTDGVIQMWQDGVLVMDETSIQTRDGGNPSELPWNSVVFSPFGKYVCENDTLFPGGAWPEYSHLVDHLCMFDDPPTDVTNATSSIFIQGLAPIGDYIKENWVNDTGTDSDLYKYVRDPGDPNPLEVNYVTAPGTVATSCSFNCLQPSAVTNGVLIWDTTYVDEWIGLSSISACSKLGGGGSTNFKASAITGRTGAPPAELLGSSSLITENRLVWVHADDRIGSPGTGITESYIQQTMFGFKIEPE